MTAVEFRALMKKESVAEEPSGFNRPVRLSSSAMDVYVDDEDVQPAKNIPPSPPSAQIGHRGSDNMVRETVPVLPVPSAPETPPEQPPAAYRLIGELFGTYILLEQETALLLVDKHAAHERMLYEELQENIRYGNRQVLLIPIPVTLSREEYAAVVADPDAVANLGFAMEDFGDGVLLVREVPVELGAGDIPGLVGEIAVRLLRGNKNLTPESLDKLYYSIACKSAIRAGDRNKPEELAEIIRRLEKNPQITHCPHGRPVSVKMTRYEIEKLFGRIV
jgi:DNA mismatch repair protein MutL